MNRLRGVRLSFWTFVSSFLLPHYKSASTPKSLSSWPSSLCVVLPQDGRVNFPGLMASRKIRRPNGLTHPSTCISNPIPSSPPSNLYPLPHKIQCVISFPSPLFNSSSNILYNGGINGRGRFKSRRENTRAGREAIAGDIEGSNNIFIGFPEGNVLVRYSRKGLKAGFSWSLAPSQSSSRPRVSSQVGPGESRLNVICPLE